MREIELQPDGPIEAKVVEEKFERTGQILHLHLAGGGLIRTTPEHPFFVYDNGWTEAGTLVAGDDLRTERGWVKILEVYDTGCYETVYNLRVAEHHTYFVGNEEWGFAVWAHNAYAILYQYAVPLVAVGHWSIDIEDGSRDLHTHQVGVPGSDTYIQGIGSSPLNLPVIATGRVSIPDGAAAIALAEQMIKEGNRGAYDLYFKSCVSYVCDILRAGGLTPPEPQAPPNGSVQLKYLIRLIKKKT